jgi:hypothetical protein
MANEFASSHGTEEVPGCSFSVAGLSSRITNLEVAGSVTPKETSHLGQAAGSRPIFRSSPLVDGQEVKVDFNGNLMPSRGQKVTMVLTGKFSPTGAPVATRAICTQASLKATKGTFVKGSATFKLSRT